MAKQYTKASQTNAEAFRQLTDIEGHVPPQAIELEQAVLGALMLEKDAIIEVQEYLREESFYTEEHRTIFRAIQELSQEMKAIDLYTVTEQLKAHKKLTKVGGAAYLAQLTLLRKQSAQVVVSSVEGIRVPKDALRIRTGTEEKEDGTTAETQTLGVYCVVGMEARFKPVEMLYSGDGFALVRAAAPADKESLRLRSGDEVIISAKNLYDGKVVGK